MLAPWFAIAGLCAAAGPLIIHLLNRRRYRVVDWAAMDFLREAMQRSRRMLEWRDLLLLLLRTACILLFGLALSRPFFAASGDAAGGGNGGPVHAVVVIDNSLSMAYQDLNGTLLDHAKREAKSFLDRLPVGSVYSIIPLCGAGEGRVSRDVYRTRQDAVDAIDSLTPVDRSASSAAAADLALEACNRASDHTSKRVVFIGDQQLINWPTQSLSTQFETLPEVQIVRVGPDKRENAWIDDFRLQDPVADVETAALFVATVRYQGDSPRTNVQVRLTLQDGANGKPIEVASKTIDLSPNQAVEVEFPHRFDFPVEAGQASFVLATVSLPPDSLPDDDERTLTAPVLASVPVVFIDQYGAEQERPNRNQYGESFRLRRLLAPVTSRDQAKPLIEVRHVAAAQVDERLLADARLVVAAGVESPGPAAKLLREYVEQGGRLVVTAGAQFDPAGWTQDAWNGGAGVLPLPLAAAAIGNTPDEASAALKPFHIDFDSMKAFDYAMIEHVPTDALRDLYREPYFFKAVAVDDKPDTLTALRTSEIKRIQEQRQAVADAEGLRAKPETTGQGTNAPQSVSSGAVANEESLKRLKELRPTWLAWAAAQPDSTNLDALAPEELADREQPRVLARFDGGKPFLVSRKIGRGEVLFVASGVYSSWNSLTKSNAMVLFDRLLRGMLEATLPRRNFASVETITFPIDPAARRQKFTLTRPHGLPQEIPAEALGSNAFALLIRDVGRRGGYWITANRPEGDAEAGPLWSDPVSVNGPAKESELASIDPTELAVRMGKANYAWVAGGGEIPVESAAAGQTLWKPIMLGVLACLLLEIAVLASPTFAGGRT